MMDKEEIVKEKDEAKSQDTGEKNVEEKENSTVGKTVTKTGKLPENIREETQESKRAAKIKAEIISWVKVVLFALVMAFVLGNYVLMNAYIPSGSMENTLQVKDRVIGLRLAYLFSEPERFDVIMFKYPDNEKKDFIKRVIGLPGETVTIKEGKVYINDSKVPLEEPYLKETPNNAGDGVYKVPKGCYFVMGDNRNGSHDSRYWKNKYVKEDKILAKAMFRFYPELSWVKSDNEVEED